MPVPKRAPAAEAIESTYYYVLCQILNYENVKTRTQITRCYTTAAEALNFVRHMVCEWEPHVDRSWEEFEDDGADTKVLLKVTTRYITLSLSLSLSIHSQTNKKKKKRKKEKGRVCVYYAATSPRGRK